MSSFKMPAHPIYLNGYVDSFKYMVGSSRAERKETFDDIFNSQITKNPAFDANNPEFMRLRFYSELEQKLEIIDNGHQLVKIQGDQWNETVSAKTIAKLKAKEIMLPYDALAIDLTGVEWALNYDTAFVSKYHGQLVIRLEGANDSWYLILLALDSTIEDTIASTVSLPQSEDITYKIISILMYMTLFKRETNRVNIKTVKARNTQGIPKYRVSQIRLIQPEYALVGKAKGKRVKDGTQLHLRRGHWRSQPHGKRELKLTRPVFIKAQWVGQGRETMIRETVI